ncbi:PHB depolymerase family esterase [Cellulosimicrobium cellulans]|uniref:extracellular catalytic domain type 1 short-chain-length polyhydroxyalkanoate depolymerase n=1 Tax=Cellulosimicrobium cellulans TaxID=1710 RepID=UPI00196338DC|nr:PHB depolymerase family esterase [Cellulosimicrobium cellulans]MBN0040375.1 PHB depolymerase family esterase [Cellulosimicrobium cellulans]
MVRHTLRRRGRARRSAAALALGTALAVVLAPLVTAPASAAGSWSQRSAGGMTVELYRPTTEPALPGGRALMISLHGCVQTSQVLKNAGNWAATADDHGMVVAIPAAPNGGVLLGCWDYYDTNHSRTNPARHDDNLLDLVSALLADASLGIDPDQVYVSGLSSGGGQAMVMGCLAPDVFAGVGIAAGPTVGTTSGQIGSVATTLAQARSTCRTFAGPHAADFATQVTSVVFGSADTTVATGYGTLNAQVMADLYGAAATSSFSLAGLAGANTAGSGSLWSDADGPRVSLIRNTGLGHAWPAGGGPGGSYVSTNSVDYPAYLTDFLFANNRRVDRDPGTGPDPDVVAPTVAITSPTAGSTVTGTVRVGVAASDDRGVDRVELSVDGAALATLRTAPYAYDWDTTALAAGTHVLAARAVDAAGNATTAQVTVTVQGPTGPWCGTATNAQHQAAGRAISYGVNPYNPYYAVGSLAYLGQGDATVTTLREAAPGRYEVATAC